MSMKSKQAEWALHLAATLASGLLFGTAASAEDSTQDLAKKLANPIASLISVPFQFNYDSGYGPSDGDKGYVNIQPVIPFSLNDNWNVISRTILPVAYQNDVAGPSGNQFGLGDITQDCNLTRSAVDCRYNDLRLDRAV